MDYIFQNPKNSILGVFWGIILKMKFFLKIRLRQFLPLRHLNFLRSFRKILGVILEKNASTYWHTDSGDIIGHLFT